MRQVFDDHGDLVAPLIKLCPKFKIILSFILDNGFPLRVMKVNWLKEMKDWSEDDCRRIGTSFSAFLRKRKTGEAGKKLATTERSKAMRLTRSDAMFD